MMTAITSGRAFLKALRLLPLAWAGSALAAEPSLFVSRQLTPAAEYTFGIEGPAVDPAGNLYVVNYRQQGTIGKVAPGATQSALFTELPAGSIGVSIRFDAEGRMYVADYKRHHVFRLAAGADAPQVYFRSDRFNQPNDMAIARDGTIYERRMGTTNGIDLSPDERTLYVGESETREIWAYRIDGDKLLAPRLLTRFRDFSLDGLRTDTSGRLFVTRILKGTVAVLAPDGRLEREIPLRAKEPTNLAFGGMDGKTVYVTQRQGGFIETFPVDRPGREHCLQAARAASPGCRR